jgi:hypothetical protein
MSRSPLSRAARLLSTTRRMAKTTVVIQNRLDIIVNTVLRWWLIAVWVALVAGGIAAALAIRANVSTTVLLLAIAVSPVLLVAILWDSSPHPTAAEILHAVHTKEGQP